LLGRASGAIAFGLLVLYPALVYYGVRHWHPAWLAAALAAVFGLRLATLRFVGGAALTRSRLGMLCAGGMALAVLSVLQRRADAMLFYPALVNAVLFCVFGYSVLRPPTIIERIARLMDGDLPPAAVAYTRRVTLVWLAFFAINGSIALYTALRTPLETWAFYNGAVAYVLIGALFGAEWLVRRRVRRRVAR
jgi:uncharacterized membrane protein